MFALERQKRILELLSAEGAVWVSKLSTELGVTEETVRRDLEKLEKQEMLTRTHGGAVSVEESTYEMSLENRKHINSDIKERLAKAAVKYIVPGDTIFLDASTTTFYMAKEIKKMSNITVITNSLRVINELSGIENIKLIAVGGQVGKNQSFIGSVAENTIANCYFVSKMFFSSKGVTESAGILESNEHECSIKQKMLANAKLKYFLCDKSKIGRVGFIKLMALETIDYFITDSDVSDEFKEKFAENDIELEIV